MPKFTGKPVDPRPADPENRVVLCELFTGADCGSCVAADVAFSHLLKTYAPSELVALQYHETHPSARSAGQPRYRGAAPVSTFRIGPQTPTFTIDGMGRPTRRPLAPGPRTSYAAVRTAIDHFLARKTSVRIQLAGPAEGKASSAVSADADGSFPPNEPIRLRLVLAEERVFMRGSNGIREHEMVVRAMPGGPQGVEIKDGKLHYQGDCRSQIDPAGTQ
jgi:hypothetical protein